MSARLRAIVHRWNSRVNPYLFSFRSLHLGTWIAKKENGGRRRACHLSKGISRDISRTRLARRNEPD
ncbi:hypothetical protein KPH14_001899 [Odynerus spinipes]|uniref:Uncharacterized protein n=1 Tax=Odynerus spinipes TaxID=1348599 RepID=A0AAD9S095_9HYME|nr:hypothetical protein KPH14_001899 [Odynerus spinipes]